MPAVPTSADVPQTPLRNTMDVVSRPASETLKAQGNLISTVGDIAGRLQDQQNSLAINKADLATTQALDEIQTRYAHDDDWQTAPQRAAAEATAVMSAAGAGLQGAATQRAWLERSQTQLSRFSGQMRQTALNRGTELATANVIQFGDEAARTAGDLSQTQEVRAAAHTNWASTLQSAVEQGFIHPDDAARMTVAFGDRVRQHTQQSLEGEFVQRVQLDPDDLAHEIQTGEGDWSVLDPDTRARYVAQARQQGAQDAIEGALISTVRTGHVTPDTDATLAGRWQYLSDNAKLSYAEHAATALRTYNAASALADVTGKSLPEIAALADEAEREGLVSGSAVNPYIAPAARAAMRAAANDPASYMINTQPNLARLAQSYTQLSTQALQAINSHAPNAEQLDADALTARLAYAHAMIDAQDAFGMPAGRQKLYPADVLRRWASQIRAMPADRQQAALAALPTLIDNTWGPADETNREIWHRAYAEHMQAYYAAEQSPDQAPAPDVHDPSRAAQGADYSTVRGRLVQLLNTGADLDAPGVSGLFNSLSPADRRRLMADPAVHTAAGINQDGQ